MTTKNIIQYDCDACGKRCVGEPIDRLSWQSHDEMHVHHWTNEMYLCVKCRRSMQRYAKVLRKRRCEAEAGQITRESCFSRLWKRYADFMEDLLSKETQ